MEFDLYGDARIDGHPLSTCRFETYLFGGLDSGLVQPVPELSNDAQHSNLVRRGELHFEDDGALNSERFGLVGVTRLWLEQNFD